jgi:hypothetical protein
MALFGEEFKKVDILAASRNFSGAAQSNAKFSSSILAAAAAQDKLAFAVQELQKNIVLALEPINKFIAGLQPQTITAFAETLVSLAKAFALFFIIGKILGPMSEFILLLARGRAGVGALQTVLKGMGQGEAAKGIRMLTHTFGAFMYQLKKIKETGQITGATIAGFGKRIGFLGVSFVKLLPVIGQAVTAFILLDGVLKAFTSKSLGEWFDTAAESMEAFVTKHAPGAAKALNDLGKALGMAGSPAEERANRERMANMDALRKAEADMAEKVARDVEAQKRRQRELAKITFEYKQQNDALEYSLHDVANRYRIEGNILKLNEDQREVQLAIANLDEERVAKIRQINAEMERLGFEMSQINENDKDQRQILKDRIALLEAQKPLIKEIYERGENGIKEQIERTQALRRVEAARLADLEFMRAEYDRQIERQRSLGEAIMAANTQMRAAQFEAGLAGLSPFERQIAQIREAARVAAVEAGRAFAAGFEDDGDGLTAERAAQLVNGLDQIAKKYREVADAQILTLQNSRTFAAGWGEAFREYVDNATNAANIARDIFGSVTSAMESMLDNFVKTGKLNFKDFAKSIIQDILKIQLKASMLKIWEGLGGGGVGGFFRSLLGFADGGRPPLDQPSIVGERGPELFMPRTAGTIIPNHALAGVGGTQQVVNNYNYNISAVDSRSVAQLFMENRRTLLGVTEQARKELPIRQRF